MKIRFERLRKDKPSLETRWDVLLGFVGTLSIVVRNNGWYEEVEFPLVELAQQLILWLEKPSGARGDFIFSSMESDEEYLIAFCRRGSSWRLASPHELFACQQNFTTEELEKATKGFIQELSESLHDSFGIDLSEFLQGEERAN